MATEGKRPPASDEEFLAHLWQQARALVDRYGLYALLVVAAAAIGLMAFQTLRYRREAQEAEAWDKLSGLPDTARLILYTSQAADAVRAAMEECKAAAEKYARASAAPWALLKLGHLQAYTQDWAGAVETYRTVVAKHARSGAAQAARPALAAALEQLGRYDEAAALYTELAQRGMPTCWMDVGRCRELSGQLEAAQDAYRRALSSEGFPPTQRPFVEARLAAIMAGQSLSKPPPILAEPAGLRPAPVEEPQAGAPAPQAEAPTASPERAAPSDEETVR